MIEMSEIITFHTMDNKLKCPKCKEDLYIVLPGILRCTSCDYQEDSF
jgi:transposase-like protein